MNIDEKTRNILSNLKSADPELVLATIGKIRESGNNFILAGLIDLLHNTEVPEIKKSVLNLLSELKNKASIPVFVEAIKNADYASERKDLVACCWQNGLSYNDYLPFFIDLVINEEFMIAFEAFTVIENLYGQIDEQVIENEVVKLKEALKNSDGQKDYLLIGLLAIIQDIPDKQEFAD